MRTGRIDVHAVSDAPPSAVFALLHDVSTWPDWADFPDGVGAIRAFTGQANTREEVVAVEQDRHFAYVLLSGIPIRDYRADVRLTPTASGGTEISWQSSFTAKVPGTTRLIEKRLGAFIDDTARRLASAAAHVPS